MANHNPTYKFPKGVSGNPNGRPKAEWSWKGLLEKVGEEIDPKSGKKFKELVSRKLWEDAIRGNLGAIKELFNRTEGLPKQQQEIDITTGGEKINFTITIENEQGTNSPTPQTGENISVTSKT